MARYVVFIRGINLGPNRRVTNVSLKEAFVNAGYKDAETVIQTGNVIFSSESVTISTERLAKAILDITCISVRLVIRTQQDIEKIVLASPFKVDFAPEGIKEPEFPVFHVIFLSHAFEPDYFQRIDKNLTGDEKCAVHNREIFLYLPYGVSKSRLPSYLLAADNSAVMRNWNTIAKIAERFTR